ncbi:MAG: hypothetical protein HRT87_06570 [Legionellales bacterium]|nr:hypothetical protein [Legionellales bacterium]
MLAKKILLIICGMVVSLSCTADMTIDSVPGRLKTFVSEDKPVESIAKEISFYRGVSKKIEDARAKYPEKFTRDDYFSYLEDLNKVLIDIKENHKNIENSLLDEINLLRQLWFDDLQRKALQDALSSKEVGRE